MANEGNLKPFTKADPRINRKGRPKSFDAFRELALQIAHEPATQKDGLPFILDGHVVTKTEMILRQWAASKDPRLQQAFIRIAYGKVPDQIDVTSRGEKVGPPDAAALAEALAILGAANGN